MRFLLCAISLCAGFCAAAQEDFVVKLNDSSYSIALDKPYTVTVNGKKVNLLLASKDTLTYLGDQYSFKYPKDYKVSKTVIEEGIEQIMVVTAGGTGFLIQRYNTINPENLTEMMLGELTKESISYGYKMTRSEYQRKLPSGQQLKVVKAVLDYKDEQNTYEVAGYGSKDEGFLVVTMKMTAEDLSIKEKDIIKLMWQSLRFQLNEAVKIDQ